MQAQRETEVTLFKRIKVKPSKNLTKKGSFTVVRSSVHTQWKTEVTIFIKNKVKPSRLNKK
jgi:hypothetical protein